MRKFSIGMIFLVYLPLIGIVGIATVLAIKYWYISAVLFVVLLCFIGAVMDKEEEEGEKLKSIIYSHRSGRSKQRLHTLFSIGRPECEVDSPYSTDGVPHKVMVYSDRQKDLLAEYKSLVSENECLAKMEDDAMIEAGI